MNFLFTDAYFIACESKSLMNADLMSAELVSPVISPTSFGAFCLLFDYFVHCGSADNLTVYTRNSEGVRRQEWSKSCDQTASSWQHTDIQLVAYKTAFQVKATLFLVVQLWMYYE
jgi:MAM domain, meprin/A5/mu